jgi:hypothetical protein
VPSAETRSGTLNYSDEQELHNQLRYDEWPLLKGPEQQTGLHDAATWWLTDLVNHIGCYGSCSTFYLFDRAAECVSRLYTQGTALNGSVRAQAALRGFEGYPGQAVSWPLSGTSHAT